MNKLFSPFQFSGVTLKNRITMAPLFVSYADGNGAVTPLVLDHYRKMAASGVAMVVVENTSVHPIGQGSPFTPRIDDDRYIEGLSKVARIIHDEGAVAFVQLNHAGRYAFPAEKVAPSPVQTGKGIPREMTAEDIHIVIEAFASAARRAQKAGFDGVELHGGTGYLLVQFLSPRTNQRADEFGGSIENRMRFPLMVFEAVQNAVGPRFPVGYRFLADEWLPDGLHPDETSRLAIELQRRNAAYLSVTAATYDSFNRPEYIAAEAKEAYMAHFAGIIKTAASKVPIIAAGRIQTPATALRILEEGTADLIGLGRVLFADPLWVQKAAGQVKEPITPCVACNCCLKLIIQRKPAICSQWEREIRNAFLAKTRQAQCST